MEEIAKLITSFITKKATRASTQTRYRSPVVGFAAAQDPLFGELKTIASPKHLQPEDLLPGAKAVAAFFLPFDRELVEINRRHAYVSRQWAQAYVETNRLIAEICRELAGELTKRGINAAYQMPTHNFDREELISFWSHKHVAFICGLGTFGKNTQLITCQGCAGRLGSLVLDCPLPPSPRPGKEFCKNCRYCQKACPTGALQEKGLDKKLCYRHLLAVAAFYSDLPLSDVCGKCANGPCAVLEAE